MNLPTIEGAFFVSNSFLEWIQSCSRGSQYYKLDARISAVDTSALTFGQHLHSALSLNYKLQEYGLRQDQINSRAVWLLEELFQSEPTTEGDFRTLNWALEIYQQYVKKYEFENFKLMQYKESIDCKYCCGEGEVQDMDEEGSLIRDCYWCNGTGKTSIMAEVPFAVKLYESPTTLLPVYLHGFIDLGVSLNNFLYPLDWKSTSRLGPSFWDEHRMSMQHKGYAWALEQTTGQKVHGHIIRALRVNDPPAYVTQGRPDKKGNFKTVAEWWNESLAEEHFLIGDGELDEWKQTAIGLVEEFFWHYKNGFFPKRTKYCSNKYGRCQYYDVCSTFPEKDRQILLNSAMFKDKEITTPNII
jgi:PD-(D/E)XK nuclease superfamily protein